MMLKGLPESNMTRLAIILTTSIIGSGAYMTQHWIIFAICTFVLGFLSHESFCNIEHGSLSPED